jgi:hypothetical protein
MLRALRQFLLVLIAFAIVGGTTAQLARSAQYAAPMTMTGMPCDMTAMAAGADHDKPMMPCHGMTPDCIKQMGCITDTGLLARPFSDEIVVHASAVDYWTAWPKLAGLTQEPEPLPPRTT